MSVAGFGPRRRPGRSGKRDCAQPLCGGASTLSGWWRVTGRSACSGRHKNDEPAWRRGGAPRRYRRSPMHRMRRSTTGFGGADGGRRRRHRVGQEVAGGIRKARRATCGALLRRSLLPRPVGLASELNKPGRAPCPLADGGPSPSANGRGGDGVGWRAAYGTRGGVPVIEVGVLFYAVSLVVAVAIGWFARAAFERTLEPIEDHDPERRRRGSGTRTALNQPDVGGEASEPTDEGDPRRWRGKGG